ncbi:unnamed protein product [Caenorhabditis angaria]|uniref:Major facilitator superfamily (MFS) profile domain-containing protein n=1 Tax=Caenorhabditis angaria TaxID=860376 RepID=A0A9P1I668_9PELO|nr:unnamed protein product [Caenorhabditis angaria]
MKSWRFDIGLMVLYQLTLFFSVQLLFVIFLEYMPSTYCDKNDYCYKMSSKCLTKYDNSKPNLCSTGNNNNEISMECVKESKNVDYYSAQFEYQQECGNLRWISATTITYVGTVLGNAILGYLSDKIGRRPVYLIAVCIGIPSLIISALFDSVIIFYIFRFLVGFAAAGTLTVGWTYGSEMISPERRFRLRTYPNWANARMMQVGVAYLAGNWRITSYICAAISTLIIPMIWYLPESPVYLEQKRKYEKADAARKKIAKLSNETVDETKTLKSDKNSPVNSPRIPLRTITFKTMLKSPALRRNFLILCFMWWYVGTAIYITDLNGSDMTKNFYVGQFFAGLVLTVSKISIGLIEPRFSWIGRRTVFLSAQAISIITYIIILILLYTDNKSSIIYTIVYMCAFAFQSVCLEPCYLCLAELVPTDMRSTVGAICNILMKVGSLMASFTKEIKYAYEPGLFWMNLVLTSVGITVVYFILPESRNQDIALIGQDETDDSDKATQDLESTVTSKNATEKTADSETSESSSPTPMSSIKFDTTQSTSESEKRKNNSEQKRKV